MGIVSNILFYILIIYIIVLVISNVDYPSNTYITILDTFFGVFLIFILILFIFTPSYRIRLRNNFIHEDFRVKENDVKYFTYKLPKCKHSRSIIKLTLNGTECGTEDKKFDCTPKGFSETFNISVPLKCELENRNSHVNLLEWEAKRGSSLKVKYIPNYNKCIISLGSNKNTDLLGRITVENISVLSCGC
jgi:hypothetical protein